MFEMITESRLIHNDIWSPNVLVHKKDGDWHIAAIIDADRAMFADSDFEFALWDADQSFYKGYGSQLDESADAVLRRNFYELYMAMFCTWAYRVQIWKPNEYTNSLRWMQGVLARLNLRTAD